MRKKNIKKQNRFYWIFHLWLIDWEKKRINSTLNKFYKNQPFVKIVKTDTFLSTNDVINTNNCIISVCKSKYKDKIIILSAIDNLIKGGSGQAVQNMNLFYNFKESEGLSV